MTTTVTDEDRYAFDVQGYLVFRGVLSEDQLAGLNATIDEVGAAAEDTTPDSHNFRTDVLTWSQGFRDLIDHPVLMPYLKEWVDARVRIDHVYPIFATAGAPRGALHGGGHHSDSLFYYHADPSGIRTGLVAASWALTDNPPGEGGFMCIPGSHKAAFARPESYDDLVIEVPLAAGDMVLFTESLTHGTLPWTAAHQRRQLFYKYCPGATAWSLVPWPEELKDAATPAQRALLEPPYWWGRDGVRREVEAAVA
jgi:ectoine hydroxylase-related dioxygenase (phytanoyl-CoA dioxygenase family)